MLRPLRGILDLPAKQCRLHKKLSQLLTSTSVYHAVELQERVMPQLEEESDSESVATEEESQQASQFIFGDYIKLNATESPYLAKLFGGKSSVLKNDLNLILLEIFKVLGTKTTASVDFEYKNCNTGCAVLVPRVKNEESFCKQANKLKWIESILNHMSEKNDAAQWMAYYLGKKYEGLL
jgi:hypothetical protein